MTRTIGVGIIGMGWMGTVHSRSYLQIPVRFPESGLCPQLVICADDAEARARGAQEMLGFARSTTDLRQVIADPDVEVVNITTPNNMHVEIVRAAAAAGKHIFCEKPVGRSPQETAEIEHVAHQAGVLTWVGYNYRWAPVVQYARQLIQEGRLGRLTHYRGRFFAGYASNPHGVLSWRFQRDLAGLGALGDLMSHAADMAHLIAGPIDRVVGNRETFIAERPMATPGEGTHFSVSTGGPTAPVTNEDYVGALVRFQNGAHGTLEVCRVIQGPQCQMAFEVHGTEGAIRWDFERMNELHLYRADGEDAQHGYTRIMSGPAHPFHAHFNPGPAVGLGYDDLKVIEAYQFLQSIANGRQGEPGFAEALAVANVLAAIERSWDTQRWEEVRSLKISDK
ncbi:MAG: Gfo/Idh/MocA family oxidoreductase [Candidatus Latescibacteria bacterium]|nr:Gfo/Idh/MocA family oxidoreductase [Candidatus Latescibacterota bacterium]